MSATHIEERVHRTVLLTVGPAVKVDVSVPLTFRQALILHWRLYVFEAIELAIFLFAACAFAIWLLDPASAFAKAVPSPFAQQVAFAIVMGIVAIMIIKSPMGLRSGAHFNPACTITYLRLGRISNADAIFYVIAHFAGAVGGVALAVPLFGKALASPSVDYVVSVPGRFGTFGAFVAELFMAIVFMSIALWTANRPTWSKATAYLIGGIITIDLVFFGNVSGVGLNPARTVGSAVFADVWTALWVYLTCPVLGMLIAAEIYVRFNGADSVLCGKIDTTSQHACHFVCSLPGHPLTPERRRPIVGDRVGSPILASEGGK